MQEIARRAQGFDRTDVGPSRESLGGESIGRGAVVAARDGGGDDVDDRRHADRSPGWGDDLIDLHHLHAL